MRRLTCQFAFVAAMAAVVAGCSTFRHEEVTVAWTDVPGVVQATIQAHAYGGTVGKVEKEKTKCGIVYEAKVKGQDGQCGEMKVADDGRLLKYKAWKDECPARGDKQHHGKDSAKAE